MEEEKSEKLKDWTKKLFDLGLKEWRINKIYIDKGDSSSNTYRIVAYSSRQALEIYKSLLLLDDEEAFLYYHNMEDNMDNINDNFDGNNLYVASDEYWGSLVKTKIKEPAIFSVNTFDGKLKLLKRYKNGVIWKTK